MYIKNVYIIKKYIFDTIKKYTTILSVINIYLYYIIIINYCYYKKCIVILNILLIKYFKYEYVLYIYLI